MARIENYSADSKVRESMVKVHMITLLSVCIAFGVVNIISHAVLLGILIAAAGVITTAVVIFLRKNLNTVTRGVIMSQVQILIIIVMSVAKHELHAMFPLMLASMAIAAIYYNQKSLIMHWIIMDIAGVLGFLFKDTVCAGASAELIIKGLLGVNVGAFIIVYLIKCCLGYINEAESANNESVGLLAQVQEQMRSGKRMLEKQKSAASRVAEVSAKMIESSQNMLEIADRINSDADEQNQSIAEISEDIAQISEETQKAMEESEKASKAAENSTRLIRSGDAEIRNMLDAMAEITDASHKIETVIKTIDDIAFQTNILALNAAVEASRAGAAGKGFAVVADEVKNLSHKSSDAVKNTSTLIQASIEAVEKGTIIAESVANAMDGVRQSAENSAEHASLIAGLTEKQTEAIASVRSRMDKISRVIAKSSYTSEKSSALARTVADQASLMDAITKEFS